MIMVVNDWLHRVVRSAAVEHKLAAGEALFRSGDRTIGLYEVLKGKVQLTRIDASGRESVLYIAGVGDILAEASLFSPTYHCDAIATADAVVRLYPKAAILREIQHDPMAAQSFMAILADQIMKLRTKLQQRDIRSARDRVRHYLALNVCADGHTVELPGTAKDFAAELGLTHEALYRALADMAADGEIERLKGRIRITCDPITRLKS
jgi:CRP-like cAMP-binding protein